ncbi:MAG TPA: hypothetical protein VER58_20210 [Thermoanaerobaculia bacterium]|nr:hypothetical protein [Thermoanaerobaculia bacterium]
MKTLFVAILVCSASLVTAEVTITIDHNGNSSSSREFKFARVPSPSKDDAASRAKVTLVAGTIDNNSGGLAVLDDGALPSTEDDPGASLFFKADTWGGRILIDLRGVIDVAQINSYSWHRGRRAPQLYYVYASDGTATGFNESPGTKIDPTACGWKKIAFVDTRPDRNRGGQYGVSITDSTGSLGHYRYLLFDVFETESDDVFGNTFYSEIDIIERK